MSQFDAICHSPEHILCLRRHLLHQFLRRERMLTYGRIHTYGRFLRLVGMRNLDVLSLSVEVARLEAMVSIGTDAITRNLRLSPQQIHNQAEKEIADYTSREARRRREMKEMEEAFERLKSLEINDIHSLFAIAVENRYDYGLPATPSKKLLLAQAVSAYRNLDAQELRTIVLRISEPAYFDAANISASQVDLMEQELCRILKEIENISREFPYSYFRMLSDRDWLRADRRRLSLEKTRLEQRKSLLSQRWQLISELL